MESARVRREPALDRGIAVATRLLVTEQTRLVMHGQRKCVQLERVLAGIAGTQVAAIDRELDRAAQQIAPALFIAEHLVA